MNIGFIIYTYKRKGHQDNELKGVSGEWILLSKKGIKRINTAVNLATILKPCAFELGAGHKQLLTIQSSRSSQETFSSQIENVKLSYL